jgi:hypothetical protein
MEALLIAALDKATTRGGRDFLCRKLVHVGSEQCVPALARLLTDKESSHMGRYALERIPDAAAVAAMRDALPKVKGKLKVGVINSLGVRRDAESTAALTALLKDADPQIAAAAAAALGAIGTPDSAKALAAFDAPEKLALPVADAKLACAEALLADGKKVDALKIYKALAKSKIKHVRVAGMRGMLAATGKK